MSKMKLKAGGMADFLLQDNGDDSLTVGAEDSAKNAVDITGLGTVAWTSTDPADATDATPSTVIGLDVASGFTANMKALGPIGAAKVKAVFTPTDTTQPPLTGILNVTTKVGPAGDINIVPGVPTTR